MGRTELFPSLELERLFRLVHLYSNYEENKATKGGSRTFAISSSFLFHSEMGLEMTSFNGWLRNGKNVRLLLWKRPWRTWSSIATWICTLSSYRWRRLIQKEGKERQIFYLPAESKIRVKWRSPFYSSFGLNSRADVNRRRKSSLQSMKKTKEGNHSKPA